MARPAEHSADPRFLHEIISTVGSSLDLEEVLDAVVRLLSDASAVHACFVYLIESGGERMTLRAASEPYEEFVEQIQLERGEGLAWWAAEHREPAFIRDNLLADARVKYVPELEEERFQSLISVPILARDGSAIGVISMHTEAPREFSEDEVELLTSSASLVAGAIENARLYEEARRRVTELEQLTSLAEKVALAETRDELLSAVAAGALQLLGATRCAAYVPEPGSDELRAVAVAPPGDSPPPLALSKLGPELAHRRDTATVTVPLVAGDELLGVLRAEGTAEVDLARAVANQTAVALKKIELIESLTEKNAIKDFFDQLASGDLGPALVERARRLGCDLDAAHLVVASAPPDDGFERALVRSSPRVLLDRREDSTRILLRVRVEGVAELVERVRGARAAAETPIAVGISSLCRGAGSFSAGFEEARHALVGASVLAPAPAVMTYDELGPHKYLLRMSLDPGQRDAHRDAIARLAAYDHERSTSLVRTLEEYLRRQGNISATAQALYVHPNTLRQRLRRVEELSGLDLRGEDWLLVAIAVKLVRLEQALGTGGADTRPAPGM